MKLIHFSDTHLGFSEYAKIDPETGLNLREADVYRGFSQVIDYIVEHQPDIIVHSGDLFDTARPANRALSFAMKNLARISLMNIPMVVISGNHSTPRIKSSGSVFELLEIFDNIYPVYDCGYQKVVIGEAAVHCVPHMATAAEMTMAYSKAVPDEMVKYNVLVSHAGVTAKREYGMGEFNELIVPFEAVSQKSGHDYIAMGHYHRHIKLSENAYYSGSTERFSFREAGDDKGFIEVDMDSRDCQFIPIKTRDMVICDPIDCTGLSVGEIEDALEAIAAKGVEEKIIQVTFNNIHRHQYVELDQRKIKEMTSGAMHVKWLYNAAADERRRGGTQTAIGSLTTEFEAFLSKQDINDLDKERLEGMGRQYLLNALEPQED